MSVTASYVHFRRWAEQSVWDALLETLVDLGLTDDWQHMVDSTIARGHSQAANRRAAASEALHVAGWSRDEIRSTLKIRLSPLDSDPLVRRYGGTAWEPWPIRVAEERFLTELERLARRVGLSG